MKMKRAVLVAVLMLFAITATAPADTKVQAFVSAQPLTLWCNSEESLDKEACLSYLQGAFDVLQVSMHTEHRDLMGIEDSSDTICISSFVPVTQLKIAVLRYAKKKPDHLGSQSAAVFLMRMFRSTYPC